MQAPQNRLEKNQVDADGLPPRLKVMRTLGVPYTDADIAGAGDEVKGRSELDALVAYLQVLGTAVK